ncbi:hypothetical protein ACJ4V0_15645 [Phreatobacter sp. HK31-P]
MAQMSFALSGAHPLGGATAFMGRSASLTAPKLAMWTSAPSLITRFPDHRSAALYRRFGMPHEGAGLAIVQIDIPGGKRRDPDTRANR